MARFHYRAVLPDGTRQRGDIEAGDKGSAVEALRRMGVAPIELRAAPSVAAAPSLAPRAQRPSARTLVAATQFLGDLSVLLEAGLTLDRALALAISNVEDKRTAALCAPVLAEVREGGTLSQAMANATALFPPVAVAMTQAGEANGRLDAALARLAAMMDQANELRRLVGTSLIYPAALLIIAVGVVLMMMLFVVPQFENLFATAQGKLPASSQAIMTASRLLRDHGLLLLLALIGIGAAVRMLLRRPGMRLVIDRSVLRLPALGTLVRRIETARFTGALAALLDGEVPLPNAVAIASGTVSNRVMADAIGAIAAGIRQGGGLTGPLVQAAIFPDIAIGFFRTGEESSRLGLMLGRLSDVLNRDVKLRLARLIAIATPAITVILGAIVAGIIASIMSAILGFNELAVG